MNIQNRWALGVAGGLVLLAGVQPGWAAPPTEVKASTAVATKDGRTAAFTVSWKYAKDTMRNDILTYWVTPGVSGCHTLPESTPVVAKTWEVTGLSSVTFRGGCGGATIPGVLTKGDPMKSYVWANKVYPMPCK